MKHYVVLEYETIHGDDVHNIPWPSLLEGCVDVTNWTIITSEKVDESAVAFATGEVFSETGNLSSDEAYKLLDTTVQNNLTEFPADLTVCELHEYEDPHTLLEIIDGFVSTYTYSVKTLMNLDNLK